MSLKPAGLASCEKRRGDQRHTGGLAHRGGPGKDTARRRPPVRPGEASRGASPAHALIVDRLYTKLRGKRLAPSSGAALHSVQSGVGVSPTWSVWRKPPSPCQAPFLHNRKPPQAQNPHDSRTREKTSPERTEHGTVEAAEHSRRNRESLCVSATCYPLLPRHPQAPCRFTSWF